MVRQVIPWELPGRKALEVESRPPQERLTAWPSPFSLLLFPLLHLIFRTDAQHCHSVTSGRNSRPGAIDWEVLGLPPTLLSHSFMVAAQGTWSLLGHS